VQGSHPLAQDSTKAHGLEDTVQPVDRDTIIGVEEVKAEEKTRHSSPM
jgi:hypothetical protein